MKIQSLKVPISGHSFIPKNFLVFAGIILMLLAVQVASAQNMRMVTGVVTDVDNSPIPGVSIIKKNSTDGTITDAQGNFNLNVEEESTLVFSFIGFKTQEKVVSDQSMLNIILEEEIALFDEVVVIGYGAIKKSDISGSVASVDAEKMMKKNPTNLAQGLQGVAAGVMVTKSSGDPEGGAVVRIRGVATINGSADPLYVVDGVQVGSNANFINPSDVESMEVLKDASATAIYGARGANGVILITTKKGKKGESTINFSANYGVQSLTGKLDVADAELFATSVRSGRANDNAQITNLALGAQYTGQLNSIDWQEAMTRMAVQQNYAISASGGSEQTQSAFSLAYLNNEGIVIKSDFSRLTARASVNHKVKDFIEIGGSISFEHSEKRGSGNLKDYAILTPTMDYVDDNTSMFISHDYDELTPAGDYYAFKQISGEGDVAKGQDNPYAIAKQADSTPSYNNTLLANSHIDISLCKGLSFRSILSYKYSSYDGSGFSVANNRSITASGTNSFWLSQNQNNTTGIESYFTYNWKNDMHNLTLMAGNAVNSYWGHWVNANAIDFVSDEYRYTGMSGQPDSRSGDGGYNLKSRFVSYYGRLMYSYRDKYIATGTVRRDGSSHFGEGNRWGVFPSAALAWRISEEEAVQNLNVFSNLKLRAGWGITGNAGGASDKAVAQLSSKRIAYYMGSLGGSSVTTDNTLLSGTAQLIEVDTNLQWESNEQTNIGLDMGFFNNGLNITMDYFIRDTKELLLDRTMRPSTGHSKVYTNAGHIRNSGLEFSVGYTKSFGDWNIDVTATGSTLKNEIISVGNPIFTGSGSDGGDQWGTHSVSMDGHAIGSYFGYVVDGIWQSQDEITSANEAALSATNGEITEFQRFAAAPQPGDYKYKDINGDGYISGEDQEVLGNGFPELNYGLTINASYKNFDAMVFMYGVRGMKIYSYSGMKLSQLYKTGGGIQNTLTDYINNAWSSENPTGKYARLTVNDENYNRQQSSAWVKDGDFMRMANIQLGYSLPESLIRKISLEKVRIYCSAENVFTLTDYEYGDPEVGNDYVLETGFDKGRYPYPRTFTAGLQIHF